MYIQLPFSTSMKHAMLLAFAPASVTGALMRAGSASPAALSVMRQRAAPLSTMCADPREDPSAAYETIISKLIQLTQQRAADLTPMELHRKLEVLTAQAAALVPLDVDIVESMLVPQLKEALGQRGLPTAGKKAELRDRLLAAISAEDGSASATVGASSSNGMSGRGASSGSGGATSGSGSASSGRGELQERLEAVARQHAGKGPQTGIFTDGSCYPNPGPGGWGVVAVDGAQVLWTDHGAANGQTTNNRMELSAIIAALRRVPTNSEGTVIYTDSNLCVQTLTLWAPGWERRGWRKSSGGKVENLDLVVEAYELSRARPGVSVRWLQGHAGSTWNEYADCLAGSWRWQ
jgi:ribonuclease HI